MTKVKTSVFKLNELVSGCYLFIYLFSAVHCLLRHAALAQFGPPIIT